MDRKIFKVPFPKGMPPKWICPTCGIGVLQLHEDSFAVYERSDSKKAHNHEAWEPDWISYIYSCFLKCSNNDCAEMVTNTGTGSVESDQFYDEHGIPQQEWFDYFQAKYFQPCLRIFNIPEDAPYDVKTEIEQSFALFFCNSDSASNHVRIALENLLTHLKVKASEANNGKRYPLSLHKRISLLPTKYQQLKDLFLAVKWLGNAGSHSNKEVTMDDVMDAYEIMEVILDDVFKNKKDQVKKLAKAINKKKGPK